MQDEYGSETYQVRVYYRGPLHWGGSPRAIRLDVTRDEVLVSAPESRFLLHPYSDAAFLESPNITCYPLAEILAEKLRAIGGQRRFAISRDLYDIHHLLQAGVNVADVLPLLAAKFAVRGVSLDALDIPQFVARRAAFAADWERRLSYLVRDAQSVTFEAAWQTAVDVLRRIQGHPS